MRLSTSIALLALLPCANAANAADAIMDAPMTPVVTPAIEISAPSSPWSGLYVGGQAGIIFSSGTNNLLLDNNADGLFNQPSDGIASFSNQSKTGFVGGVHVGYDVQYGSFVMGAVADVSYADFSETRGFATLLGNSGSVTRSIDVLATARARAGVAFDSLLVYGTGGLAYANVEQDYRPALVAGLTPVSSNDDSSLGYTVGGGAEFLVTPRLSFGAEYLYTNLGHDDSRGSQIDNTGVARATGHLDDDVDFHTVWAKVSYRLN